ncbi:F-box/LRR-repeat protein 12 [Sceloporus undulatus]|uniref:F-box/LRR-repeat protein 12 n=1 Tax=Sceloporus undulatus TaxID=8520 RepID=UPI001C4B08BE|nr:F-box/LRR-repeat protein 12 [Sceloporus undulatus]
MDIGYICQPLSTAAASHRTDKNRKRKRARRTPEAEAGPIETPFLEQAEERLSVMAAPSLSALPDSLLLQILACLPPRDRVGGARVCRRWRRLVSDKWLWRHLDLTSYKLSSKVLWYLLRNHLRGTVQTLKARGSLHSIRKQEVFTPALMQALDKQCPHLHSLCLTETDLRSLSYYCLPSSLMTLELNCCEIPSVWFHVPILSQGCSPFPKIQHLIIRNVPAFSNQHLVNIARQGTLKTLVLSETYRVTDMGIQTAAPHLGDLTHLVLRQCCIGDSAMHFIGRHMKCLSCLDLGGSSSLTDVGLPCLASLPVLESLCLESCGRLSPEAILALGQVLPQLKHLDLSRTGFDNGMIHKIQASLPSCVVASTTSSANSSVGS